MSWRKCSLNRFGHDGYRLAAAEEEGASGKAPGVQGPNGSDPLNFKSLPYIHDMTDPPSYTAPSFTSCNLPPGAHFRFQATLSPPQHKATRESCPFQQQHARKMPHHMNTKKSSWLGLKRSRDPRTPLHMYRDGLKYASQVL